MFRSGSAVDDEHWPADWTSKGILLESGMDSETGTFIFPASVEICPILMPRNLIQLGWPSIGRITI